MCRLQATRLAITGVGSLAVDFKFHIKNREKEGGTLVLDGRRLAEKSNNQPIVSDNNRGGHRKGDATGEECARGQRIVALDIN